MYLFSFILIIDSSYLGKASNDRLKPYGDFVSLLGEVRPFPRTQPLNGHYDKTKPFLKSGAKVVQKNGTRKWCIPFRAEKI